MYERKVGFGLFYPFKLMMDAGGTDVIHLQDVSIREMELTEKPCKGN
ncbi:MAG TPA: hypothetical protein PLM91_00270 [Bacillota bacterium]|jgi:hypothetical protein|nr:hypothetical protein [Bacillota bacterium]HOK70224.1 hypothetical protein [Bacillota bacterium]HOL50619.1 hypothetical protein [Bacillota bacterium]HPQ01672.1 hypothetical protein [Bacillota bacterium]